MTAPLLFDWIAESTVTTGDADWVLAGAVAGYRTFGSKLSNGQICLYAAHYWNGASMERESGIGTYASGTNTLQRTTVKESTNANSKVSFSGPPIITMTLPGRMAMVLPADVAAGDLFYYGANGLERLAKGTAGQFLRQNAGLTAPEWASGWETIYSGAMSGSVFDVIDLAAYDMLELEGFSYCSTNAANLGLRFSADNGGSFDAAGNNEREYNVTTSTTAEAIGTVTNDTVAYLGLGASNNGLTAGAGTAFEAKIFNFRNANKHTHMLINSGALYQDNSYFRRYRSFNIHKLARANNAIRFLYSSGDIHNSSYVHVRGWR